MTTHDEQTNTRSTLPAEEPTSAHPPAEEQTSAQAEPTTSDAGSVEHRPPDSGNGHSTAEAEPSADKPLFADGTLSGLRSRWDDVQAAFVDDPKECVQKADALVGQVVEQLTTGFAETRARLEAQWDRGENASTEDLRVALTRYREFFQRLLSA